VDYLPDPVDKIGLITKGNEVNLTSYDVAYRASAEADELCNGAGECDLSKALSCAAVSNLD